MADQISFLNAILSPTIQDPKSKMIPMNSKKYNIYVSFTFLQKNIDPQIPISQRSKDSDRIDTFVKFIENEYKKTKEIPDLNTLHIGLYKNRFYLMDGQHRWTSLCVFFEKNKKLKDNYYLMPSIYLVESKKEMKIIASRINNIFVSEEYLALDEEDEDEYDYDETKEHVEKKIKEKYNDYISDSTRCRSPRFHLSHFKDYVFDHYPRWNGVRILDEIEKLNKTYEKEYKQHDVPYYNAVNEIVEKKKLQPFFLSRVINEYQNIINPKKSHKRIKVNQAMRMSLWNRYFYDETEQGECVLCNCKLKMSQYHVSHIQSLKENGTYDQSNLTIMCSKCNTSLGSKNLNDYMRENGVTPSQRYRELNKWEEKVEKLNEKDLKKTIEETAEKSKRTRKKKDVKEKEEETLNEDHDIVVESQ